MGLIQVSSTVKAGTSTFCEDFCDKWPIYSHITLKDPRDIIKFHNIKNLNSENAQEKIFEEHFAVINIYDRLKDNIIFDGSILNDLSNLFYLKQLHDKKISDEFIVKMVYTVKRELSKNDIIFYIPIIGSLDIKFNAKLAEYRGSIDNILGMFKKSYDTHEGTYFPLEDSPAMLDIMGDRTERTHMAALYINLDGTFA